MVNFDEVQIENEDLKARTREQSQRIDELQTENERLNGQLHYLQNNPFAVSDPGIYFVFVSYGKRKLTTYCYRQILRIMHR